MAELAVECTMVLSIQLIYAGTAVLCAGIAVVHDSRRRKIPNLLTGPAILLGLFLHLGLGGFRQLGESLAAGCVAGTIFLLFYAVGGMGAGDVKLMTAIGCIAGISAVEKILLVTVIAGAVMAIVLAVYRGRLRQTLTNVFNLLGHHRANGLTPHAELNIVNQATLRLPYAVPIAIGCFFVWCMQIQKSGAL